MSAQTGQFVASDAIEIESLASEWIERRFFGDWGAREEAELNAWRAQSLAHEIAFLRLEAGWRRTERLAALRSQKPGSCGTQAAKVDRRLPLRATAIAIASTILGIAGLMYQLSPTREIYGTPIGGHRTIAFADGSKIELNTDTLIRASNGRMGRQVELVKGEAYFQIRHDNTRPFVVIAAGHRLTDLGTKFLVRRDSSRLEISLLEGRVELKSGDGPHTVVLTVGDVAVANANSLSVTKRPTAILDSALGWRSGVLVFQDTPLAEAVAEFNRYNRRKLVIADAGAGRRIIGATFPVNRIDLFAGAVRNVLGLRVEEHADEIVISR